MLISTLIVINYFIAAYLTILWQSVEQTYSLQTVLIEPALYNKTFKIKASFLPLGVFFNPIAFTGILFTFIVFTSVIFGLYIVDATGEMRVEGIYDWYIILIYTIPILLFIIAYIRSSLIIHCAVCEGKGQLSEYNSYLERSFDNELCFCCQGKKVIKHSSRLGRSHKLLLDNLIHLDTKINKVAKLEKELEKLNREIEVGKGGLDIKDHLEKLSQKVAEQKSFQEASANFYRLTVSKLMTLIYNYYLTNYILERTRALETIEDKNIDTYLGMEKKHSSLGMDSEILFKIESLVQEIGLSQSLTSTKNLQTELEKLTQNLKVGK
jgi:hypothetical protein